MPEQETHRPQSHFDFDGWLTNFNDDLRDAVENAVAQFIAMGGTGEHNLVLCIVTIIDPGQGETVGSGSFQFDIEPHLIFDEDEPESILEGGKPSGE